MVACSMSPTYRPGESLIIRPSRRRLRSTGKFPILFLIIHVMQTCHLPDSRRGLCIHFLALCPPRPVLAAAVGFGLNLHPFFFFFFWSLYLTRETVNARFRQIRRLQISNLSRRATTRHATFGACVPSGWIGGTPPTLCRRLGVGDTDVRAGGVGP